MHIGIKEVKFDSWAEFTLWKEKEEENSHTCYTIQKRYRPIDKGMSQDKSLHNYVFNKQVL